MFGPEEVTGRRVTSSGFRIPATLSRADAATSKTRNSAATVGSRLIVELGRHCGPDEGDGDRAARNCRTSPHEG
jgi:hypothetical protein